MDETARGLEVGRRRILHPGPLRWLRALGWMLLLGVILSLSLAGLSQQSKPLIDSWGLTGDIARLAISVLTAVLFIAIYVTMVMLGEGREATEVALRKSAGGLFLGTAVGVGMFCTVMALLVLTGAYEITGPHAASATNDAAMAIGSGFTEELIMRAVIFRLVMRAFGVWPALAFSAALFGAGHLFNPNATVFAAVCIAIEAGLSLAALYLATGNLWAPIGFHVAWNFVQAYVFGAHVSGIDMGGSLWTSTVNTASPAWLSGGAFGPEASAPALTAGSLVAAAALLVAHRRGRLRPLPDLGK